MDDIDICRLKPAPLSTMLNMFHFERDIRVRVPESQTRAISPAMKDHLFYPEIREGKGCKYPRTDLDRSFAVSSKIAINEIYKQEAIKNNKASKDTKMKAKSSESRLSSKISSKIIPGTPRCLDPGSLNSSTQG